MTDKYWDTRGPMDERSIYEIVFRAEVEERKTNTHRVRVSKSDYDKIRVGRSTRVIRKAWGSGRRRVRFRYWDIDGERSHMPNHSP